MEFSKEQVEYLKEEWTNSPERNFIEFANSLIKPESKKLRVEIEINTEKEISITKIENILNVYCDRKDTFKVTELPEEIWTDHHMKLFALYYMPDCKHNLEDSFNNFKAERKSEIGK